MQTAKRKEYSITVNIFIFLTLICIVGATRIVVVSITGKNQFESIDLIDEVKYDADQNMTGTIQKVKNTIENYYNINVYYGSILKEIAPKVNANVLYDDKATLDMLQRIKSEFEKYPKGLIDEIERAGYNISIYLVKDFNNSNIALANRTSAGNFNIFLSNDPEFEKSMHHEFYHILEYYIKLEFDISVAYGLWNTYNPKGFSYINDVSNINGKYVYGMDGENELSFVTLYSKYSETEDRAEVFSEMMTSKEDYTSNKKATKILYKMKNITEVLKTIFMTVGTNEYWQRYEVD